MPHFWERIGRQHSEPAHRKLQDGLFQIASQTCSLLVQVNNTHNISYGQHATNIQCNNLSEHFVKPHCSRSAENAEQLVVLIPPNSATLSTTRKESKATKPLPTNVNTPPAADGDDIWNQSFLLPGDCESSSSIRKWGHKNNWCRPSCIPISIILILIFLVVLLPLLNHTVEKLEQQSALLSSEICQSCRVSLVESIPQGLTYPNGSTPYPSTFETWRNLILAANSTIEIASFYWTLQKTEVYPDPSSAQGDEIFQALLKTGLANKVKIKIAQNAPTQAQPNIDTEFLAKRKAAEVRSLNFAQLLGAGVLHTKLWIIDRRHLYVGSANMDWRSLTQVKELGIVIYNCSCLAEDMGKIFNVYWALGQKGAKIPDRWPNSLATTYNINKPMNLSMYNDNFQVYLSSSPPPFSPNGRANDIDAVLNIIERAEKFVYISVMDYLPLIIYGPKVQFWPVIDDALRKVAIENKVHVRMLISLWNHSRSAEDYFLRSLADVSNSYNKVSIQVKRFVVPANATQQKIPFGRVNHNKYMVTDNTAYIGTSNWSGDYFISTAGVGFILHDPVFDRNASHETLRSQLQGVFERDWNSSYAIPLKRL